MSKTNSVSSCVDLKTKYETRVAELQKEIDEGNALLTKLNQEGERIRVQLLRIQGAQMVLKELIKDLEPQQGEKTPEEVTSRV